MQKSNLTSIEICAGAGGQALGLEMAGFEHVALIEIDPHACQTLRMNRPHWNVIESDLRNFSASEFQGIDLVAGGVPCPPFSIAGQQLGQNDERDLFPEALRIVSECKPRAVMIENVRGLLSPKFDSYRDEISRIVESLGYKAFWTLLNASDYGVPQLRPRVVFVALRNEYADCFAWPIPSMAPQMTVGDALYVEMKKHGWHGVDAWRNQALEIAPTIVGGSKKHGGPDLGPTRSKRAWAELGVNGHSIAEEPPSSDFDGMPRLTVSMAAILQGFPVDWKFSGKKTASYRQVGNAFPPPVAHAVGKAIRHAIEGKAITSRARQHRSAESQPSLF